MNFTQLIAHQFASVSERTRARVALGPNVGEGVHVLGMPSVVREGELVVGSGVVIVSTPAAVTIVSHAGAVVEIREGAVLESGVVIRARKRVVIGKNAHVGVGCVIDDDASDAAELVIADGEILADGTIFGTPRPSLPSEVNGAHASNGAERIRAVITSVIPEANALDSSSDVRRLPEWDSLTALRVVVALEKELGVMLPHDLFVEPRTFESIAVIAESAT